MKKIVALSLVLLLLSGCGPGGPISIDDAKPTPITPAYEVEAETEQLIRVVYRQAGSLTEPTWTIIEFVPNGTLYLVSANSDGICPLVDFGGYNSTSPFTIRDFNEYLKSGD